MLDYVQSQRYADSRVSVPSAAEAKGIQLSQNTPVLPDFESFHGHNGLQPPAHQQHSTGFSPPFTFSPLPQANFDPALFGLPNDSGREAITDTNGCSKLAASNPNINLMADAGTNGTATGSDAYTAFDSALQGTGIGMELETGAQPDGTLTDTEKDPFLTLLEQLAENEHSRGGPSDLDFFLGGSEG